MHHDVNQHVNLTRDGTLAGVTICGLSARTLLYLLLVLKHDIPEDC